MELHGLQKLTLLDYPGKVACTVFLGGCDFRCPYCHNWELVDGSYPPLMTEADFLSFLQKRRGILEGVCVTGGEPLLHRELPDFLEKIHALGYPIKLDTNGGHPQRLNALLDRGLVDYVAMDIKNSPQRYGETIGRPVFDPAPILESVRLLMQSGVDYEFRTTVVRELHEEADFLAIAQWLQGARRYFLQPFTDRDTVPVAGLSAPSRDTLEHYASLLRPYLPMTEIRGIQHNIS